MMDDYSADTSTTGRGVRSGTSSWGVSGVLETQGDSDWFQVQLIKGHIYDSEDYSNNFVGPGQPGKTVVTDLYTDTGGGVALAHYKLYPDPVWGPTEPWYSQHADKGWEAPYTGTFYFSVSGGAWEFGSSVPL